MVPIFLQYRCLFVGWDPGMDPFFVLFVTDHLSLSMHQMYNAVDFELHVQEPYFTQLRGNSKSLCTCQMGPAFLLSLPNIKFIYLSESCILITLSFDLL